MKARQQLLALCKDYQTILLEETPTQVRIAACQAPAGQLFEALRFISGKEIDLEIWPPERMEKWQAAQSEAASPKEQQGSIVGLLHNTLITAIQQRASDIHFEPAEQEYRIRLRIDGVLQPQPPLAASVAPAMIARLKVLANLDIAERRLPQDGQMMFTAGTINAAFRVATLPCRYGEKVVLRLLQQTEQALEINALGMPPNAAEQFRLALQAPQGMILVTGPTGSGKTITLYSALALLNQPGINLCSVEDPVEIPLPGLNQTQINPKAGLNFRNVLRALLRQDPDVIMVGEIRDSETAEIAIKAAQTGHLVLSTLHTNSTTETLTRLEQMGIPRWMFACALNMVVAQRLVRKLCPHCKRPGGKRIRLPGTLWPAPLPRWQAVGCERCYGGYYGRSALFELLPVTPALKKSIVRGEPEREIALLARQKGMTTLFESGCLAVEKGLTSLEELYRVLGVPDG